MRTTSRRDAWAAAATTRPSPARTAATAARLRTDALDGRQHATETIFELDLRPPPKELLCSRDVRLADLRIVDGQRLEDDLALRAGDADHRLGELEDCELTWVAEIDRKMLVARREQEQT